VHEFRLVEVIVSPAKNFDGVLDALAGYHVDKSAFTNRIIQCHLSLSQCELVVLVIQGLSSFSRPVDNGLGVGKLLFLASCMILVKIP